METGFIQYRAYMESRWVFGDFPKSQKTLKGPECRITYRLKSPEGEALRVAFSGPVQWWHGRHCMSAYLAVHQPQ